MISKITTEQDILVRRPLEAEKQQIEDVLDIAFRDNPFAYLLFGGRPRAGRIKLMNRWMVGTVNVHTLVAVTDNQIVGALKYADSPYCEPQGWSGFRFLFDCVRAWGWRSIVNLQTMRISEHHPKWHHRHLLILGVRAKASGKGVGSKLLAQFMNDADHDEIVAMLETDTQRAKALYERFGFEVFNEQYLKNVRFWYMKRIFGKNVS